jgi:hypothetical protein
MSEILVSAKNTFIETAYQKKFVHRRSFSDTEVLVDAREDNSAIYAIREVEEDFTDYSVLPDRESVGDVVSRNPSMRSLARLNSSDLTIENYITGEMLKFSTGDGGMATVTRIDRKDSYSSFKSADFSDPDRKTTKTISFDMVLSNSMEGSTRHSPSQSPSISEDQSLSANSTKDESLSPRGDAQPNTSEGDSWGSQHLTERAKFSYIGKRPDRSSQREFYDERPLLAARDQQSEYIDMQTLAAENQVPDNMRTTVMMRNIPCRYDQSELLWEVMELNLPVNFLYLPGARKSIGNLGYAFLNFAHPSDADIFIEKWNGHHWHFQPKSTKVGTACYATLQGFASNIQYYSKMKISRSRNRPYVNYDLA